LAVRLHSHGREATRLVSVSQHGAGAFLNAVPSRPHFQMPTWALRIAVQKRLGLPLQAAAAAAGERYSRHGKSFDCMGDVAQNDGEAGHQTRHFLLLEALAVAFKSVWGVRVQREPSAYIDYSDYRPDLVAEGLGPGGCIMAMDLKLFDAIGSDGTPDVRGSMVGFGNTQPRARLKTVGLRERGAPADGPFRPKDGTGYVPQRDGDYARTLAKGHAVYTLLFETFGGFGPDVVDLLRRLAAERQNRLTTGEYDLTSWSARSWTTFTTQKLSVAVHMACAAEIAQAFGISTAGDPRAAA